MKQYKGLYKEKQLGICYACCEYHARDIFSMRNPKLNYDEIIVEVM